MQKNRVIVGMSGGVDSSVAASLLVDEGFDVVGMTIKTYNYEDVGGNAAGDSSCCSLDGINDARFICDQLGIPHYVVDLSPAFKENVIDMFVSEYLAGNTPNPCVICNRKIKWEEMIKKAKSLGADFVAMGHYARVKTDADTNRFWIARGKDISKDQSYALWAISQESLAHTIFPLAEFTKEEARAYAVSKELRTANKGESYEICFIPDNNYARFLKENVVGLDQRVVGGEVVLDEQVIGHHAGYPFYTIGQRRGLNVAVGEPVFVKEIDAAQNRIYLGRDADLMHTSFTMHSVNLMMHAAIDAPHRVTAKIRYKDEGSPATIMPQIDGSMHVRFDEPKRAITPGQSAVFYEDDDIVAGGIIRSILE